jgi:hypothetical protein
VAGEVSYDQVSQLVKHIYAREAGASVTEDTSPELDLGMSMEARKSISGRILKAMRDINMGDVTLPPGELVQPTIRDVATLIYDHLTESPADWSSENTRGGSFGIWGEPQTAPNDQYVCSRFSSHTYRWAQIGNTDVDGTPLCPDCNAPMSKVI